MIAPGIVAIWSGLAPRLDAFRIPQGGITIGSELVVDDRMNARHARVHVDKKALVVEDLGSNNGSYINGASIVTPVERSARVFPTVLLRTGRTLWLLVDNVDPYLDAQLQRRGTLVVGGTLGASARQVDRSAIDEQNIVLAGPRSVGRELARSYAVARAGTWAEFAPDLVAETLVACLQRAGSPLRTIILDGLGRLAFADISTIADCLETDVRFVTIASSHVELRALPPALAERLAHHVIPIPKPRLDELAPALVEIAAGALVHPTAIEAALIAAWDTDEDLVLSRFREGVAHFRTTSDDMIRNTHVLQFLRPYNPAVHAVYPEMPPRR